MTKVDEQTISRLERVLAEPFEDVIIRHGFLEEGLRK